MLKELSLPKSLLEGVKTSSTARCFLELGQVLAGEGNCERCYAFLVLLG